MRICTDNVQFSLLFGLSVMHVMRPAYPDDVLDHEKKQKRPGVYGGVRKHYNLMRHVTYKHLDAGLVMSRHTGTPMHGSGRFGPPICDAVLPQGCDYILIVEYADERCIHD